MLTDDIHRPVTATGTAYRQCCVTVVSGHPHICYNQPFYVQINYESIHVYEGRLDRFLGILIYQHRILVLRGIVTDAGTKI